MKRTALIFREWLLPPSETFIFEQARSLERYDPILAGLRPVDGVDLKNVRQVLLSRDAGLSGAVASKLFRLTNIALKYYDELRSAQALILHAHFATDAISALPIVNRLDIPLTVALHGYDVTTTDAHFATSPRGRYYLKNRRKLFDRAASFLCVSEFIREIAARAGFPERKLQVHYTGVDCTRFCPSQLERDPKLVLFVGRLVEKKGCMYLLQAMKLVQRAQPHARLEIIGDGPLAGDLKELALDLGLNATFRGVQDTDEVKRSMARARVLCNPSVTAANGDSEGFGMVFAEAQAVGTPIVSSRNAAIPEVVKHGKTGILCTERKPREIADGILTFLENEKLWVETSGRAAAWVRSNFDIAKRTRVLEEIFDKCIIGTP